MALTKLDPNTTLIVVDPQKGIVGLPAIHPIGDQTGATQEIIELMPTRSA